MFEEIQAGNSTSKQVFMAMPFGIKELNDLVDNTFRDAVNKAGFDLFKLNDEQSKLTGFLSAS